MKLRLLPPAEGAKLHFRLPGSVWSGLVLLSAALAAGGGIVERIPPQALHLFQVFASKLGHSVEVEGDRVRVEYVPGRAGGEAVINVGCSFDYATFIGVVAGAVAPPGMRVTLRGCEELVEADWRPLLEAVAVYGGRAWPAGSPSSLVIIESVGRGRLRAGLWRVMRREDTVAHIAGLIVAALAAPARTYVLVWPRDPPAKSDIDPAVYAAEKLASIEYSPAYNRFSIEPGEGGERLVNRPECALALHLAGLAASGYTVTLKAWEAGNTPYEPIGLSKMILEQLGYKISINSGELVVSGVEEQVRSKFWLLDYPEYAAPLLTLAAARRGEATVEDVPKSYRDDAEEVIGLLASLGYSVESGPERLRVMGEPQLLPSEPVATCTSPHVLPAAATLAATASTTILVERAECLSRIWPEFYHDAEAGGLAKKL
ncbi:EPSP synthase (3-phosphoshikimate 1-carboxyvinyltransferase) [Pyrolobus fumarii 1A]|uniref:EPSP synthase (3-phosphoshikimate 1-carboxyvinyltransferase) n=1 Tax=Pyrolobus fumarii (strain DSM 11204 / 1A) TaxID=694429 RepID=G0EDR5_PYRF1|nr:3-phosphoshikimate 1-carboxyvinyltransferase [Pyrolobus fumarii]AEM38684.1 EPSP synthase (3-phosphoshikimate 1-carboxyvinyltransferase) [Pyrolobus fumarii 1A]